MTKTSKQVEAEVDQFSRDTNRTILKVTEWKTPCTSYPLMAFGAYDKTPDARIVRTRRNKGLVYPMEDVDGYGYWANLVPIKITSLEIKGRTWMTDEPINWIGMQRFAEAAHGNVFVAGLGLGMLCHALIKNDRVKKVTVLEREKAVIQIIGPLVKHPKIEIVEGDFWKSPIVTAADVVDGKIQIKEVPYDTIILDIWVWGSEKEGKKFQSEIWRAIGMCKVAAPYANVYVWGLKEKAYNPAIEDPEKVDPDKP
ncbi:Uncharacterised protein [uncultured archaeon]|nr:Uncharacterised protein [uncultured archaeon]